MAKFPEAEERLLKKKICMKCNARNSFRATRCRKCAYPGLRIKSKDKSGA
ncbi:MAG: 50S ribosomal protein L40e [Methanimicrococcus sp.]|nr:50S ribosomal protein L40e [Methanimicrococcus sp.]MCL2142426.1 50S ribosomal protein L40e [Methanimicrococcus sp.]